MAYTTFFVLNKYTGCQALNCPFDSDIFQNEIIYGQLTSISLFDVNGTSKSYIRFENKDSNVQTLLCFIPNEIFKEEIQVN